MITGNIDAADATSTVGSNGKGSRHLMSKPSGLKWQASASASKSSTSDAASSSNANVMELSHVGLEQETNADAAASRSNWKWYEYPWATIRTNDPIFRSMASFVVGESESKKLDSLSLTQLLCTALTVFDVRSLQLILVKLGGSNFNRTKDELIGCAVMLLLNRDSSEMTNPKCERKIDR